MIAPQGSKEWNGKTIQKDFIQFENDESGTLSTFPNDEKPVVGMEIEYEVVDNGFGAEIKKAKKGGGGFGGGKTWTPEQVAQQDAVKITAAALESGQLKVDDYKVFFVECKHFMIEATKPKQEKTDKLPFD